MRSRDFNRLVLHWKKTLRLMDWDIDIFRSSPEVSNTELHGVTKASHFQRFAQIQIFNSHMMTDEELEVTLVHELLHCYFPDTNPEMRMLVEQGVETLSQVLVQQRRAIK